MKEKKVIPLGYVLGLMPWYYTRRVEVPVGFKYNWT